VLFGACYTLKSLVVNCAERAAEASAAGAVEAVVAALRECPADMMLQYAGCLLLADVLKTADIRRRALDSGAGEVILVAMRTHAAEQQVQAAGCSALGYLFLVRHPGDTQASEHAQLAAEATNAVVAAMMAHASDGDVQGKACIALSTCASLSRACQTAAAAVGGIEASVAALRAHTADAMIQTVACNALALICSDMPGHQAKAIAAGGIEAVIQALRGHPTDAQLQQYGCDALASVVHNSRGSVQRANAAGALDAVVASVATGTAAASPDLLDSVYIALLQLVSGHEAAAVLAGALEALEQSTAATTREGNEARSRLIRQLQPAAQQHDAQQCTHAGCKRCAASRARGAMCALAGCGIRTREGGKRLRRCITCRTARYCSEAHQLDDWQRHKPECFALRDRQAGASGAAD
jgi:hypothetical protein